MPSADIAHFCAEHVQEIETLASRFADYEPRAPNVPNIIAWLKQFNAQHRALALKLATRVRYYGTADFNALMPPALAVLKVQLDAIGADLKQVIFTPLGAVNESGHDVSRRFRNANRLSSRQRQFKDLVTLREGIYEIDDPVVVFMDDFVGTGKQIADAWNEVLCQIVPDYIPIYLLVAAAFKRGADHIEDTTPIKVLCVHSLGGRDQLHESANKHFNAGEKTTIQHYCDDAGNQPLGFGELGALVSFSHDTPNNTISVIRGSEGQTPWRGLLPRWEDLDG